MFWNRKWPSLDKSQLYLCFSMSLFFWCFSNAYKNKFQICSLFQKCLQFFKKSISFSHISFPDNALIFKSLVFWWPGILNSVLISKYCSWLQINHYLSSLFLFIQSILVNSKLYFMNLLSFLALRSITICSNCFGERQWSAGLCCTHTLE